MSRRDIVVFTGTSGAGRKTIAKRVSGSLGLIPVRSATTRVPRNLDKPDSDYHYISEELFENWERNGDFLQTVEIDHNRYGVLRAEVEKILETGQGVSLVLNREGAEAVKRLYGEGAIRVFVYVDKQTVRERMESKGVRFEIIESYLDHYADEVTYRKFCELVFENVDLDRTVERIVETLTSRD